jgi:23S rRNA (uracil1939-C5)-methyltransferase
MKMYEVEIEKLDHQARGIAHINDKIVFVENALPLEKVKIRIVKENKKIMEAVVTEYITRSKNRVESSCPYYKECGGCDLLHLSYEKQLIYKENKIKEIMNRYAELDDKLIKSIVPSPVQYNYRNKITLKVKNKIGYYKKKSYDIVEVENCLLANKKINEIIKEFNEISVPKSINELVIRSINEDQISLTIYLQQKENIDGFINKLAKKFDSIKIIFENKLIKETGKSNIIGRLGKYDYQMSQTAFFQVNTQQTINLYDKIKQYVKNFNSPITLDLYCGTGSIGIYISEFASKVIGVEINSEAIENAKINAKNNNIKNIEFLAGDAKTVLSKNNYSADLVIVDPPRSGLDLDVVNDIIKINPKDIIYVSCDPITLARDLKLFSNKYKVVEITPFDMFPNTYHVECVVLLKEI